jgi:hypothetical protein
MFDSHQLEETTKINVSRDYQTGLYTYVKHTSSFDFPKPKNTELSEDDLEELDTIYTKKLSAFCLAIFAIDARSHHSYWKCNGIFGGKTNQLIEKDLRLLSDNTIQNIEPLTSLLKDRFSLFDTTYHSAEDILAHQNAASLFIEECLKNEAFKKNLELISLKEAINLKEKQTPFWRDKKNYAYALNLFLKLPLNLIDFLLSLYILMIVVILHFAFLTAAADISLFLALPLYFTSMSLMVWAGNWFIDIEASIPNLMVLIGAGIDYCVEALFNLTFFETELASTLFDINQAKQTNDTHPTRLNSFWSTDTNDSEDEEISSSLIKSRT